MKDIMDDYGDVVVAFIAGLELMSLVVEIMLFGSNPQSLASFIDTVTAAYQ